jgi:uncharacterized SAM-binding protein YcdF (DUF218 family)
MKVVSVVVDYSSAMAVLGDKIAGRRRDPSPDVVRHADQSDPRCTARRERTCARPPCLARWNCRPRTGAGPARSAVGRSDHSDGNRTDRYATLFPARAVSHVIRELWGTVRWLAITGVALFVLSVAGFAWFATPPAPEHESAPTDAIIVLTGGRLRLQSGLDLLREGKGRKLFVSGVNQQVDLDELLRISGNADWASCCTVLGHDADNTLGNALETAQWMRQQGFRSLRLVTAWYHMPRSLLELNRAMPEIDIIAHPVFPDEVSREYWWASRSTVLLLASEYGKYLGALLRPVVERLRPVRNFRSAEAEIGP